MLKELEKYSKPVLRIALSFVFLYFGISQISSPFVWTGFVPDFVVNMGIGAESVVIMNGVLEILLGSLLLLGFFVRISSGILFLHLIVIASSIGFNPLGIRDFGLAFATLAVFLNGYDWLCLGRKFRKNL
jgi:uncharacterized membrane protein YphA (DoxX/SURF4 family)